MANYKQHVSFGFIYGLSLVLASLFIFKVSFVNTFIIFAMGILGSILPDIDSDNSIPVRILFEMLGLIVPITIVQRFLPITVNLENQIFFILAGYLIIRFGVSYIFFKFTVHRGIIHSIPAAAIAGGFIFLIFTDTLFYVRFLFAFACFGGYILHLTMDEIWSVDLANARLKKSFGTALSFKSDSIMATTTAYLLIFCMLGYIVKNVKIPNEVIFYTQPNSFSMQDESRDYALSEFFVLINSNIPSITALIQKNNKDLLNIG